jgi:rod shape-determining protein MreD
MIQFQSWTQMVQIIDRNPSLKWIVGCGLTGLSVLACLLLLPTRFPGMELAGIGPNWLLIWVVAWSLKRSVWSGMTAGLVLGLLQDAMTENHPTHALSLMAIGFLTSRLQKQRFLQEDFISVALVTFGMAVVAETILALQFSFLGTRIDIWKHHQLIALSSAILSSLWAPVLYFPLNQGWRWSGIEDD